MIFQQVATNLKPTEGNLWYFYSNKITRFMKKYFTLGLTILLLSAFCRSSYEPDLSATWKIVVETTDSARNQVVIPFTKAAEPVINRYRNRTEVVYPSVDGMDIEVCFTYTGGKNWHEVVPTVTNREKGWVVKELVGPEIADLEVDVETEKLLFPGGAGLCFDLSKAEASNGWRFDKKEKCYVYRCPYPCKDMTMQWAQFSSEKNSLYIGSHDPEFRWKVFQFRYFPEDKRVAFRQDNLFTCFEGETWAGPPTRYQKIKGTWKKGSEIYRKWFLSVKPVQKKADWIRKNSGWLLTILRQQNDELMWDYNEVGTTLLDAAKKRGIDIVSLFGWTVGGHDRFYPDYDIDPRMGGKETLKESIRKIHDSGHKVTVYANGQLIDKNDTQFWPDTGRFISVLHKNGDIRSSRFWKYRSAGPRDFGLGCYQSEVWRKRLLNLAMQAHEIGADGIIYDQLGVSHPDFCYADNHGHSVPSVAYERDRVKVLEWISAEMKKLNPDFLVLTEGLVDCEINGVGMFHGYSKTAIMCPNAKNMRKAVSGKGFMTVFPDMFRYTFPEADFTVRCGSPASTRANLNFGTTFGYKHEIESRYTPDKNYLVDGTIPLRSEYEDVKNPPPFWTMEKQDPAEVVRYSKAVMDFRRKYEDILYVGNFISDDGFTLETDAPHVIARAFVSGRKMGVVVWNASDEDPASFTVTPDNKWKLSEIAAPEGEPLEGELPAQSIRLLIYKR